MATPAAAATFVYVSNAEDGDIGMYTLQPDGSLQSGPRFKAEKLVMPMAVNPNKRFLIAAVRSKLDPDGRFSNPYLDRVLGPA